MKTLKLSMVCIILFLFAVGCSELLPESDTGIINDEMLLKSKKKSVPVSGEFSVWVNVPPAPVDGILTQLEYGVSNEPHPSHLGITKLFNEEVIYLSANTGQVPWDQVDPWQANANVVLTAANGDELFIALKYEIDPELFPKLLAYGNGPVTGGTGRFDDVTGEFDFTAVFNVIELKGTQKYTGEIMY